MGIIFCRHCQQLHGSQYDCSKPVQREFPRVVRSKEILELRPEQEIALRMELGGVTILQLVGGVQIISETFGGRSVTLSHAEFAEAMERLITARREEKTSGVVGFLLACTIAGTMWLAIALFFFV